MTQCIDGHMHLTPLAALPPIVARPPLSGLDCNVRLSSTVAEG